MASLSCSGALAHASLASSSVQHRTRANPLGSSFLPARPARVNSINFTSRSRQSGSPSSKKLQVRAVSSETFWVTVTQAVGLVLAIASSGVIVGVLLSYRCRKDAEAEVARLQAEGKTPEEVLMLAVNDLREQGVDVKLPELNEEASGVEVDLGNLSVPTGAQVTVSAPLAQGVGRRRRPQSVESQ